MNGVLFINKPENWTSRDIVNKIGKILETKKVGHTGTLDPMAKGVLIICVGRYTKLVDLLTASSKEYKVEMKLGIKTDTADITGNVLERQDIIISEETIKKTFQEFPKEYIQKVPIYSAVKVNGKKLYEYARNNISVEVPSKKVQIHFLEILDINFPKIKFKTCVSKGTYIRSLIEDIALKMGAFATMTNLERIKNGSVSIEDCLEITEVTKDTPLKQLDDLFNYPKIEITEEEKRKVENGNRLYLNTKEEKVILSYNNEAVAIYERIEEYYKMLFKVI